MDIRGERDPAWSYTNAPCPNLRRKGRKEQQVEGDVPIRDSVASWNCVYWVVEALKRLQEDGKAIGTSELDWTKLRNTAMAYIERKKQEHRFDGRGSFDMSKPATYDLLEGAETIP